MTPNLHWHPNGSLPHNVSHIQMCDGVGVDTRAYSNPLDVKDEFLLQSRKRSHLQVPQTTTGHPIRSSYSVSHSVPRISYPIPEQPQSNESALSSCGSSSMIRQDHSNLGSDSYCGSSTSHMQHGVTTANSVDLEAYNLLEPRLTDISGMVTHSASTTLSDTALRSSVEPGVVNPDCLYCTTSNVLQGHLVGLVEAYQKKIRDQNDLIEEQECVIRHYEQRYGVQQQVILKKRRLTLDQHDDSMIAIRSENSVAVTDARSKRSTDDHQQHRLSKRPRKENSCVRCWKQKRKCYPANNETKICENCQKSSLSMDRLPCIRRRIVELDIFRCGTGVNDTWTTRKDVEKPMDLITYTSPIWKDLILSHGFGPDLKVKVKPYRPVRGDKTDYTWRDDLGQFQQRELPPYALSDIDRLIQDVKEFVVVNQDAYIRQFISEDDVTTAAAFRIATTLVADRKSPLLEEILQLWTAARLIEKPWQISGTETLGIDTDSYWQWVPVTPIMDTQLDQVVIKTCLAPLRKSVLKKLQKKFEKPCRNDSLEMLVTAIILLNTIEEATRHDHEFATFFGHEYSSGRKRFEDYELVEDYFHSATTLLTHVRLAFEGHLPQIDGTTDVTALIKASEDDVEREFIVEIDKHVNNSSTKHQFRNIREEHQYEAKEYWVHQLFLKEWDGRPISIREKAY